MAAPKDYVKLNVIAYDGRECDFTYTADNRLIVGYYSDSLGTVVELSSGTRLTTKETISEIETLINAARA